MAGFVSRNESSDRLLGKALIGLRGVAGARAIRQTVQAKRLVWASLGSPDRLLI